MSTSSAQEVENRKPTANTNATRGTTTAPNVPTALVAYPTSFCSDRNVHANSGRFPYLSTSHSLGRLASLFVRSASTILRRLGEKVNDGRGWLMGEESVEEATTTRAGNEDDEEDAEAGEEGG
jgi:hypothetical protein